MSKEANTALTQAPQKGLTIAFAAITAVIGLLCLISLYSFSRGRDAMENLWTKDVLLRVAKEGVVNLSKAGQLPKEIETTAGDLTSIRSQAQTLREQFQGIRAALVERNLSARALDLVRQFGLEGETFYAEMENFFPIKGQIMLYSTEFKGESRSLVDVLSQRELDHIRYVQALRDSVRKNTIMVGTTDYHDCGFYQWYAANPPIDKDLAEIIREDIHPLHENLHEYAARIGQLLAAGDGQGASQLLDSAEEDLTRLGRYFAGVRQAAYEKQFEAETRFARQSEKVDRLGHQAAETADALEAYLEETDLQPSLERMRWTTERSGLTVFLVSVLGVIITVLIAIVTFRRVKTRSDELQRLTRTLTKTKAEIEDNRNKLQHALDEVSLLLQQVSLEQDFSIRFANPHLMNCQEAMNCRETDCPCYGNPAERCWLQAGTHCHGQHQEGYSNKIELCRQCPVFQAAVEDPVYYIGEQFNAMMSMLEAKNSRLEDAYNELKTTYTQLLQQEKLASIGKLASGVAHEINTPLGFITSNLGRLNTYVGRFVDFIGAQAALIQSLAELERQQELQTLAQRLKLEYISTDAKDLLTESLEGAQRVSTIVQSLMNFSRVDQAAYESVDINACLDSTLTILKSELQMATITKTYGELPLVGCYPQQINQVFMNLLINAGHAIGQKGEIGIRTWIRDEEVCIAISDTGCGIKQELVGRVFEPFFTTKEVGTGTGLGLSISYDIVKKHHGRIDVTSQVGQGTTFTVTLPVSSQGI